MRAKQLLLFALFTLFATVANAQWQYREHPYTSDFEPDTEYYLYNVESKQYFLGANAWGTQASVGAAGYKVKFAVSGTDAVTGTTDYVFSDYIPATSQWMDVFISDADGNMYVDRGTQGNYFFHVDKVDGEDYYRITSSSNDADYPLQQYKSLGIAPGETTVLNIFVDDAESSTHWQFVSPEQYEEHLDFKKAYELSLEMPTYFALCERGGVDVSEERAVYDDQTSSYAAMQAAYSSLKAKYAQVYVNALGPGQMGDVTQYTIINPDFSDGSNGWTTSGRIAVTNGAIEAYSGYSEIERETGFDVLQRVTLPAGKYTMIASAFFRCTDDYTYAPEESTGYLVAGNTRQQIKTMASEADIITALPTSLDEAAAFFTTGAYENVLEFESDGTPMQIGFTGTFNELRSWVAMGPVLLFYNKDANGGNTPDGPEEITEDVPFYETAGIPTPDDAVDLGLSVKWAPYNLGTSVTNKYGSHYALGSLVEQDGTVNQTDAEFNGNTDQELCDLSSTRFDATTDQWGCGWRLPTIDELKELQENVTVKEVVLSGVKGYMLTSNINGNSTFIPASGMIPFGGSLGNVDTAAYLWSGNHQGLTGEGASLTDNGWMNSTSRLSMGYAMRPVYDAKEDYKRNGGIFYLYNKEADMFLERGEAWGGQATLGHYGLPVRIASVSSSASADEITRLRMYDTGKSFGLGDNQSDEVFLDSKYSAMRTYRMTTTTDGVTFTDENGLAVYIDGNILKASASHTPAVWQLITEAEHKQMLADAAQKQISDAFAAAGIDETADLVETDFTEAIASASLKGSSDGWTWTPKLRVGSHTTSEYCFEGYKAQGALSQTVTGLEPGLYKLTANAMFRNGSNKFMTDMKADGYTPSTAYLEANGYHARIASWAEYNTAANVPNSMAEFDQVVTANPDSYKVTLYTVVGTDGKLDISFVQDDFVGYGWFAVNNVQLSLVEEEIKEMEIETSLISSEEELLLNSQSVVSVEKAEAIKINIMNAPEEIGITYTINEMDKNESEEGIFWTVGKKLTSGVANFNGFAYAEFEETINFLLGTKYQISVSVVNASLEEIGTYTYDIDGSYDNTIARGEVGTCVWYITNEGELVIAPADGVSGDLPKEGWGYDNRAPWYEYRDNIFSAKVMSGVNATSCCEVFYGLNNMFSIDLSGLNTQNVTTMRSMFSGCSALTFLDLSYLNTQNVTDMGYMFSGCSALETLDLTNFNTEKVSFYHTRALSTKSPIFDGCSALTTIISNNETPSNLRVDTFTDSFENRANCTLVVPEGKMILYASSDGWNELGNINDGSNTIAVGPVGTCVWYVDADSTLVIVPMESSVSGDLQGGWSHSSDYITDAPWGKYHDLILSAKIMPGVKTKSCSGMFCGLSKMETADLSELNTQDLTSTNYMFYRCSSLTTIDLSNLNTQNVTSMSYMFYGCSSLTSLDLSNLNTQNVSNMEYMLGNCSSLKTLNLTNFNTENVYFHYTRSTYITTNIFSGCSALTTIISNNETPSTLKAGTFGESLSNRANCTLIVPKGTKVLYKAADGWNEIGIIDDGTYDFPEDAIAQGEVGTCVWYVTSEGQLVIAPADGVSGDLPEEGWSSSDYQPTTPWGKHREVILSASIMPGVNATSCRYMFYALSKMKEIDLSNFNTQNVTDMSDMFRGCSALTSLNLSQFNTQNVMNMSDMFLACSGLTSLNLSNFDTQNVTDISKMFYECTSLTSLDLSSFNTQNVTDMEGMFLSCSSLTSLDLSNFNTQNVTNMKSMFSSCSSLTSLDLSNFNTQNVTNMENMFHTCLSLTTLDVSSFNTQNVTYMGGMFEYCRALTSLDLSNFNTRNVTGMGYMFYDCSSLTSLDLSNFNTENVESMGYIFAGCSGLTTLDLSNFNMQEVFTNYMSQMFSGCSSLTTIISNIETPSTLKAGTFNTFGNRANCTLKVPTGSRSLYLAADGWNELGKIFDGTILEVDNNYTLASLEELADKFDANITSTGHLTVDIATGSHIGDYVQQASGSAIFNQAVSADKVSVEISLVPKKWKFVSFPYDVKVSDIQKPADAVFAIRKYSGEKRANGEDAWVKVGATETLNANEGYIINADNGTTQQIKMTFPAAGATTEFFSTQGKDFALATHSSDKVANRDWNFLGNPFPSYYTTQSINEDVVLTIWNGNGYTAYSTVDDNYMLKPFESFFIQSPLNVESISLPASGRSHGTATTSANQRRAKQMSDRNVLNFVISATSSEDAALDDSQSKEIDRARIVINELASTSYEAGRDAAKFMSLDKSVPQIFVVSNEAEENNSTSSMVNGTSSIVNGTSSMINSTLSMVNGTCLAIDERPMSSGHATLGVYSQEESDYTLSLNGSNIDTPIYIIDNVTGAVIDLTSIDYHFTATAGTDTNRFTVVLNGTPDGIEEVNGTLSMVNGQCYNLAGQRINNAKTRKGIVIVNGKKTIKK